MSILAMGHGEAVESCTVTRSKVWDQEKMESYIAGAFE